ncbi:MAG: hypothetical protein N2111_04640 [Candidatus Sumerlaeaceae bacterium]|nr:hypothetical protein [Candidatus Sumerlaeaceae bacterium]
MNCARWNRHLRGLWPEAVAVVLAGGYCFALAQAARALPAGWTALGFTQVDQAVYHACAREIFENGNGLFYASPYSPDPASPRVYTHFVFLVAGWLWHLTAVPLTALDAGGRLVLGAAMLALAMRVGMAALPLRAPRRWAALVIAAGGGLAWLVAAQQMALDYLLNLGSPDFSFTPAQWLAGYPAAVAQAEGGYGEWSASVFRNLQYTVECAYHVLFFGAALLLIRGRTWAALVTVLLTWWAHPFTGLELGLIALVFLLVEAARKGWREGLAALGACALLNAVFLFYYLLWLPRFPEHASVAAQIRAALNHPMTAGMLMPAFGLLALLPWCYWLSPDFRADWRRHRGVRLMTVWLGCASALVFHDRLLWFAEPHVPMHFLRGYLHVPLAVFSALGVWRLARWLAARGWRRAVPALLSVLLILHLPDNLLALHRLMATLNQHHPVFAAHGDTLRLLERLDAVRPARTVAAIGLQEPYSRVATLVPVLTHHRALAAHHFNSPDYDGQRAAIETLWHRFDPGTLRRWHVTCLLLGPMEWQRWQDEMRDMPGRLAFEQDGVRAVLWP